MSWSVDQGLDVLLAQINTMSPNRSRASDGSLGDAAHASRASDHNPEHPAPPGNPDNQVDARDFTHDPAHGVDIGDIFEAIRLSRDPRVKYAIFNGRMFSSYPADGYPAWTWRPYSGSDPHKGHGHLSVVDNPHDVATPWSIGMLPADEKALINRVNTMIDMSPENPFGDGLKPEPNKLALAINGITKSLADLAAIMALVSGKVSILAASLEEVSEDLATVKLAVEAMGPAQSYTGEATVSLVVRGADGSP